jgi:hypothetical protein
MFSRYVVHVIFSPPCVPYFYGVHYALLNVPYVVPMVPMRRHVVPNICSFIFYIIKLLHPKSPTLLAYIHESNGQAILGTPKL